MPERVQMTRDRPWRAEHPDAVIVDRRSRWGNPFRIVWVKAPALPGRWVVEHHGWEHMCETKEEAATFAVARFRFAVERGWGDVPWPAEIRAGLSGKDLACWCPLDQPCHADVLLAIANGEG